jgi:endonuclease G, mitochondrial
MIPTKVIQETEKRFAVRTPERIETERKLRTDSKLQVDEPERIEKRIKRLRRGGFESYLAELATPPAPAPTEFTRTGLSHLEADLMNAGAFQPVIEIETRERILDKNNLMSINYLERGLRVSRSVARIRIRSAQGQTLGFGTGFMVSPRLLMTNNHVLETAKDAAFSLAEFNFQDDLSGRPLPTSVFELDPNLFFITDETLDFSLVAVKEKARDGSGDLSDLRFFGWNRLIEDEGKAILGEYMNIIQHPNGEPKQLALRDNQFIDLLENFLHYKTDTAPGSSGSPVFNDQWEIVGLHHSGVPQRDANGRIMAVGGGVWQPAMGEFKIQWIANEGIRVSRLIKQIKQVALNDAQRRLRTDLLEKQPPLESSKNEVIDQLAALKPAAPAPVFSPQPRIENGNAIWTLPLEVSVRIGGNSVETPLVTTTAPSTPDKTASNGAATNGNGNGAGPAAVAATPDPTTNSELAAALAEVKKASTKKYYDAAQDKADRDQYYSDIPHNLTAAEFYKRLHKLLETTHTTQPAYKPATRVYPWVDLQPNLKLRSIYSGMEFEPEVIIQEDFRIDQERAMRLQERMATESFLGAERIAEELSLLEATLPYNCEHVVPQSWFEKREPMRGDIHHLFACESGCNSFRGNTPYFDFTDFNEVVRDKCGKREENKFEPGASKGTVARAVLYFLLRYPGEINRTNEEYKPDRIATLLRWHKENKVSDYERHRNAAIFKVQGNRNPLIDHPDWAEHIDFLKGLG